MTKTTQQNHTHMPTELAAALRENPSALHAWDALPPSHQREHIKYVAEARQSETRERRARKTIDALVSNSR